MLSLGEIAAAVGGRVERGDPTIRSTAVSTDTRSLAAGALFVALRGPHFDGHRFLADAADGGAIAALVAEEALPLDGKIPLVVAADTLQGLGDLAAWHRRRFEIPLVAVTGSTGKTSTKDMVAAILETRGPTLATAGNFNNLIGLPLTLLRLEAHHRFAVVEMGMNRHGEIARLSEIAAPHVGVITHVDAAHTEGVGGLDGVARAKGELFAALGDSDFAAVNIDDPRIAAMRPSLRPTPISFGRAPEARVRLACEPRVDLEGTHARICVDGVEVEVTVPLVGVHQAENAMAAMAATLPLGFTPAQMAKGLAHTPVSSGRLRICAAGSLTLLDDTYNANPRSMAGALATLAALAEGGRAIAVLGDMLELGDLSVSLHREVGAKAAQRSAAVYALGPGAAHIAAGAREAGLSAVFHSVEPTELLERLRADTRPGDVILFKGSRGMRMEQLVAAIAKGGAG